MRSLKSHGLLKNKTPSYFLPVRDHDNGLLLWGCFKLLQLLFHLLWASERVGYLQWTRRKAQGGDWKWWQKAVTPCSLASWGPGQVTGRQVFIAWSHWPPRSSQGWISQLQVPPNLNRSFSEITDKLIRALKIRNLYSKQIHTCFLLPTSSWRTRYLMENMVLWGCFPPGFFGGNMEVEGSWKRALGRQIWVHSGSFLPLPPNHLCQSLCHPMCWWLMA